MKPKEVLVDLVQQVDKTFNNELLNKIKTFIFCGEILPNETANKILERFENCNVINTYGPTESYIRYLPLSVL